MNKICNKQPYYFIVKSEVFLTVLSLLTSLCMMCVYPNVYDMMYVRRHIHGCACVPECVCSQKTTSGVVLTFHLVSETESRLFYYRMNHLSRPLNWFLFLKN